MPANRSRTQRWRDYLTTFAERGGGIEIAPGRADNDSHPDLLWRVRVLEASSDTIVIEMPGTMGSSVELPNGIELVAVMGVGQNRWMFHTRVLEEVSVCVRGRMIRALRLGLPEHAERCRRRNFERISTAALRFPGVTLSPLLAPASAPPAEWACKELFDAIARDPEAAQARAGSMLTPELGSPASGLLLNIGGGGAGVRFDSENAPRLDGSRLYWLEIDLRPTEVAPVSVTARLAHTHLDSEQNVHVGLAFEFALNPGYRPFVVEKMTGLGLAAVRAATDRAGRVA